MSLSTWHPTDQSVDNQTTVALFDKPLPLSIVSQIRFNMRTIASQSAGEQGKTQKATAKTTITTPGRSPSVRSRAKPSPAQCAKASPANSAKPSPNKGATKTNYYCVTCTVPIIDDKVKAMPCDFCNLFTHLSCDVRMSTELYDAITNSQDNSLIYLCINCRQIMPSKPDQLFAGIVKKVESVLDQCSQRESISEKILNSLSKKIVDLDRMCNDHSQTFLEHKQAYQALQSDSSQLVHEMKAAIQSLVNDTIQTTVNDAIRPLKATIEKFESLNRFDSYNNQMKDREFPNLRNHIQFGSPRPHMGPPPNMGNPLYSSFGPPNIPGPQYPRQYPYRNNPRPMPDQSRPDLTRPNPDVTLVVYNTNKNENINKLIEQLHTNCNIYSTEIKAVKRLPPSGDRNPPIIIACESPSIKWRFIKAINQLREKPEYTEYDDVFARPFLNEEDLRKDRQLVRKLKHLRELHQGRTFKISRGSIYEVVNDSFIKFEEAEDINQHRSRSNTASSTEPEALSNLPASHQEGSTTHVAAEADTEVTPHTQNDQVSNS